MLKNGFLLTLLGNISDSACKFSLNYCETISSPPHNKGAKMERTDRINIF